MIEKPTTAELEKSPSGRAFLYTLGGLILERGKDGKVEIVETGDLDHDLLWHFFDAGWRWRAMGGRRITNDQKVT